jgi:hypothetical protein
VTRAEWVQRAVAAAIKQHGAVAITDPDALDAIAAMLTANHTTKS